MPASRPPQYKSRRTLFFVIFVSILCTSFARTQDNSGIFDEARVAILWDHNAKGPAYNDQASFASAFRSLNIQVDTLTARDFSDLQEYNLLVVPNHSARKLSGIERIMKFVEGGGNLITDAPSPLAEFFGVHVQDTALKVSRMLDRYYPEDTLRLSAAEQLTPFISDEDDEVFCKEAFTREPVVVGRISGQGKIIYFGMLFDPVSTGGYSRFPFLMEYVRDFVKLRPVLRREFLEMYFDPGYRHNDDTDSLVRLWHFFGVRVIHAAAWHQHPTWTYNYARLIEACHAQGMLVYAWLEPPHVSEKFWRQYPAWQEVNFRGQPVPPHWRYLQALTDSACLEKVKAEYLNLVHAYDWDGVNLAELYFESERGPRNSSLYTPMHPSARTEFKRKHGFDPASLLDPRSAFFWKKNHKALNTFERYRVQTVSRLHEEFLRLFDSVRAEKGRFDIIVTAFDDIGNPELRSHLGSDVRGLIKLQKKFAFTLQVEDPQSRWSTDPRRYGRIGKRYRKLLGKNMHTMLDLNILQFRDVKKPGLFPTSIQTGIECYQMVSAASSASDRVSVYSESSVRHGDLQMLSYAASSPATIRRVRNGWNIRSPFPVVLELPEQYAFLVMSNGERFASDRGRFALPEGEYVLLKP